MESVEGCRPMRVTASPTSGRHKSVGDEEDAESVESSFLLAVEPEPTRAAAPVGMMEQLMPLATTADALLRFGGSTKANFEPIEVESP